VPGGSLIALGLWAWRRKPGAAQVLWRAVVIAFGLTLALTFPAGA
jgi:hypothetical protein